MTLPIGNITGAMPSVTPLSDATKAAGGADKTGGTGGTSGFGDILRSKLGELNNMQNASDVAATDMATGKTDDVAGAMLTMEQANIAMELTTTIRNKVIDAYQEVLRMQM